MKILKSKKTKQVLFTGGVALAAIAVMNTLANRFSPVARVRNIVNSGV